MPKRSLVGLIILASSAAGLCRAPMALAQGSGSSRSSPPRATRPRTVEEFYVSFWRHLQRPQQPYTNWPRPPGGNGSSGAPSPHGEFAKFYANKIASDNPAALPYGAILVAANYAEDQTTLVDISVMYRVKGADPQHSDWYWMKYLPNGSIARTPASEGRKAIAGRVASCIECHSKAARADFAFSNDPAETSENQ
ncbi:MAG: cytochrome P460 family protein [Planctomycetes bacterium]|nr:cytochrome P460 family protein [Planctomycetota bacterium]